MGSALSHSPSTSKSFLWREEGAKSILGASRAGVAKSGTGEGINPEPKDQIPKEQEPQGGQGQEGYLPWDHPLP